MAKSRKRSKIAKSKRRPGSNLFCAIPKQVELTEEPIEKDLTGNDFIADSCVDLTGCDKFSSDKLGSTRDAVNLV
jgi:hypothetical protein